MVIYLLLAAGLFMGWSLGTNDAANAFGTAVATRVVKYRTAIIVIAAMVMLGAILLGHNNINKLSSIATNNEVVASVEDVEAAIANGELATLRLKSALKAFIVFASAAITVFVMSYLKFPVSTSQSVVGAVIGAGLVNGVKTVNFGVFKRIAIAWISSPTVAGLLTYLVALATKSYFA
jgi:PiT family inorganic phosphate transporter